MGASFLLILAILALVAWLGNQSMTLSEKVREARTRTRAVRDQVERLEAAIERIHKESTEVDKEIAAIGDELVSLRQAHEESQRRLTIAAAKIRRRLLILSDRRVPGDHEWVVTVTNLRIGEIDGTNSLADEWTRGRDYLVWAETDKDASERALRRFSARPGFVIKSVEPVKEDLYRTAMAAG
jgi:chromosome segregation ATPase